MKKKRPGKAHLKDISSDKIQLPGIIKAFLIFQKCALLDLSSFIFGLFKQQYNEWKQLAVVVVKWPECHVAL